MVCFAHAPLGSAAEAGADYSNTVPGVSHYRTRKAGEPLSSSPGHTCGKFPRPGGEQRFAPCNLGKNITLCLQYGMPQACKSTHLARLITLNFLHKTDGHNSRPYMLPNCILKCKCFFGERVETHSIRKKILECCAYSCYSSCVELCALQCIKRQTSLRASFL